MIDPTKAIIIPNTRIDNSLPVKFQPNLTNLIKLAPAIAGTAKKKENSAATYRLTPNNIEPKIVEPERDVPGIKANI